MFSSPKSNSSIREIPIPKILMPFLKKYFQNPNLYVLSCKEKQIEPRVMQYQFKKQLKQCNLPLSFSFHSLRHPYVKPTTKKKIAEISDYRSYSPRFYYTNFVDIIISHEMMNSFYLPLYLCSAFPE